MDSLNAICYTLDQCFEVRFQNIEPFVFEHFIADLFKQRGYDVTVTSQSGDYGVDILIQKDGVKTAVQVKRFTKDNIVGVQAITHLDGGKRYYSCDKALCVTTSSYTQPAQNMALKLGVELWNWERLKQEFVATCGPTDGDSSPKLYVDEVPVIRLADAVVYAKEIGISRDAIRLACLSGEISGAEPKGQSDWTIPLTSFSEWLIAKGETIVSDLREEKRRQDELKSNAQSRNALQVIALIIIIVIVFATCTRACS